MVNVSYKSQYSQALPFRIKLSNGLMHTNTSSFTLEEMVDATYLLVLDNPDTYTTEELSFGTNTSEWVICVKTESELVSEL
jgi:hypothetical protein